MARLQSEALHAVEELQAVSTELATMIWDILVFFSPRVLLSHGICLALIWHLYRQGTGWETLLPLAVIEEFVTISLYYIIPNSWATILTLVASVYVYEKLLGPRISVKENAVLVSDDDLSESLHFYDPNLKFEVVKKNHRYHLSTNLQYAEYVHSFWNTVSPSNEPIDTDDVISVHDGCDYAIIRSIRSAGAESKQCFYFLLDGEHQKTVTCIAENAKKRDEWLAVLKQFFGRQIGNIEQTWLKQLGLGPEEIYSSEGISTEKVFDILVKANRKTDKAYVADLLRNAVKKSNGGKTNKEVTGLDSHTFSSLFDATAVRPEIQEIFDLLLDKNQNLLSLKKFEQFLNQEQQEEIQKDTAKQWIKEFETIVPSLNLTQIGFTNYLLSEEHSIRHRDHLRVCQDMKRPLSHYFIATSHNTYLTKDQLKGKSSVEAYINAFKRGCKCVELDCWDGPNNEPIIYHGHTLTSKILFKDVVHAIEEYAFEVSNYPVILSFENHCSVDQQRVMVKHLKEILKDKLYLRGIPDDEKHLPSPEDLKGFVIIKNKKLRLGIDETEEGDDDFSDEEITEADIEEVANEEDSGEERERKTSTSVRGVQRTSSKKKNKVPKIAQELSDLVSYCQATHFRSFDYSFENAKHFEMSSFGEKPAMKFCKDDHQKFIRYNKRQLSRIYPAGKRFDSSNYDPMPLWCVGSQLVALNYQTPCREMQVNQGLFQCNGGCGYVLKPDILTRDDLSFNPQGPFTVQKLLTVKVISGHQLPFSSEKSLKSERQLHVQLRATGIEEDNAREKTKTVKNNGFNPVWNEEVSVGIRVPELAMITLSVFSGDSELGQFTLPFIALQQGFRNVPLQNKFSEPLPYASLFVHIGVERQASGQEE